MMIMRLIRTLVLLLVTTLCHHVAAVPIDKNSYNTLTKDKNAVFLKLFVEWCTNCQEMANDWNALEKGYKDHPDILIGEIDCGDSTNMEWCDDAFHIIGVPTLLYGDPSNEGMYLEEYREEKDFVSLQEFAHTTLTLPVCNPTRMDGCTEKDRKLMESYWGRSMDSLEEEIKEKEAQIQALNDDLEAEFGRLQKEYNAKDLQHYIQKIDIKDTIRILKEIKEIPMTERRKT